MNILETVSSWIVCLSHCELEDDACHAWQDTTVYMSIENTVLCSKYFTYFYSFSPNNSPWDGWYPFIDEDTEITSNSRLALSSAVLTILLVSFWKWKSNSFFFPCFRIRRMERHIFGALELLENSDIKFSRLSRETELVLFWGKFLGLMGYLL